MEVTCGRVTTGLCDTLTSMTASATCCAIQGIAGVPVTVEADQSNGLPGFTVVGLTDRAIQEAKVRVKAAVQNSGFGFPTRKLTVNLAPAAPRPPPEEAPSGVDLADIRGQPTAKRALEIAAAGGHNLLMVGPPGSGKSMLARALASLLPDLGVEASLEVAAVYSLRGALR